MITKIEITTKDSINYVREQLFLGGKTLSNFLLSIPLEKGKIFAIVPDNTDSQILFQFETGGVYTYDQDLFKRKPVLIPIRNDSRPFVIDLIENYIKINESHCCIFEEPVGQPNFPYVIQSGIEYVHIENEMYYFFDEKNSDREKLEDAFTTSEGYYFLCGLSSLPIEEHSLFAPFKEITSGYLKKIAENLTAFITRAYDGEGYLMWERE